MPVDTCTAVRARGDDNVMVHDSADAADTLQAQAQPAVRRRGQGQGQHSAANRRESFGLGNRASFSDRVDAGLRSGPAEGDGDGGGEGDGDGDGDGDSEGEGDGRGRVRSGHDKAQALSWQDPGTRNRSLIVVFNIRGRRFQTP